MADFDPGDDSQERFAGYGPARLPDPRDDELSDFVTTLVAGGPPVVAEVLSTVTEKGRQVLRAYAERMASLAVRRQDPTLLPRAIVALVVGGLDQNKRDSLMIMAPIEDSAARLEKSLSAIFEDVSKIVGHPATVNLMMWLTRRPETRTLASMRFIPSEDEDGFRYRLDW
jgi:hypothetical protein